ncbi:cytochrome P450 [Actinomadura sp. LD22]|uniref:Cytochrome P450 n=1 Tax=Actinomadura physcomitrii TaxID=2650748 RepID=A0A6I4MGD0_9ACTN|nr:cytochrome P450 [Actinomadura physcomitrii]MWA04842.1 cytochrome P450 [Actinomadura physcomitrii]
MTTNVDREVALPNLMHASAYVNGIPHDLFDYIRSQPGLFWFPVEGPITEHGGVWILTRTKDIREVDGDGERFICGLGLLHPMMMPMEDTFMGDNLMSMDGARHARVRRVIARGFGPRMVAGFEPWIREIVTETLDELVATKGPLDYVPAVAAAIPSRVIARILGVPLEDRPFIVRITTDLFAATQGEAGQDVVANLTRVFQELFDYVETTLMPLKREHPGQDMSTVITQGFDAGEVTLKEALFLHQLIMNAGFETTHTTIGRSMWLMLEDPEIERKTWAALDEVGSGLVVDEFLRYISPVIHFVRVAAVETEVAGQKIRKGDQLAMFFTAANRDPETFTDPHTFDPWRNEAGSLTFGAGPHRCLGAPVARLQVQILFEEMAKRNIRLRMAGEPKRGYSNFINAIAEIPVEVISGS